MRLLCLALVLCALGAWTSEQTTAPAEKPGTVPAVAGTDWETLLDASQPEIARRDDPNVMLPSLSLADAWVSDDGSVTTDDGKPKAADSDEDDGSEKAPADTKDGQNVPSDGLHPTDLKLGFFYGDGSLTVHRNVAESAANDPPGVPLFAGFRHRTETSLKDAFVTGEWGFRWGDLLMATTSLDTNIGMETQFRQTSIGTSETTYVARYALYVLRLPTNTKGLIALDNENRMLNFDQCFALPKLPIVPQLRFLAGWRHSTISSDIGTSFARYLPLERHELPGTSGWTNNWRNSIPFTTGFQMDQRFWWTAPYVGMRLTVGNPQKLPGQWYIEGKGAPYVWGDYEFDWKGSYDDGFFFVNGQSTTNLRLHGHFLEVKGGTQFKLTDRLHLEVWSKLTHLNMKGSGREEQASQNNFLLQQSVVQEAVSSIDLMQNSWAAGANLVVRW